MICDSSAQFSPALDEESQQNLMSMEADETLGAGATIAAVLFSNITHPEWKKEFPCEYSLR